MPAETFVVLALDLDARLPPNELLHFSSDPLLEVWGNYEDRPEGFKVPLGLKVIVSGHFETIDDAEKEAQQRAMTLMGMICFSVGVKATLPRVELALQRLDATTFNVRAYSYDGLMTTANLPVDGSLLTRLTERVIALPAPTRERVGLAMRWYTVGLGQADDLNRFLSHWIGLEAIGDLLHKRLHQFEKAACDVCEHPAGKSRDRKKAGMKHVIAVVTGKADLFETLDNARNKLFHGLEDIEKHSATIVENVRSLEVALARGILEVIGAEGSNEPESAGEPVRTVASLPQLKLDGRLVEVTDEERRQILYAGAIQLVNAVAHAENFDDGGLKVSEMYGVKTLDGLGDRLIDRRITRFNVPGVDYEKAG